MIRAQGLYTPMVKYSFSTIFDKKLSDIIDKFNEVKNETKDTSKKGMLLSNNKKSSKKDKDGRSKGVIKSWDEAKESCIKGDFFIDCRCDEIFNQGYIHTLRIYPDKLKIEEMKIRKSVYIETHLGIKKKHFKKN